MSTHHRSTATASNSRSLGIVPRGAKLLVGNAAVAISLIAFLVYAVTLSHDYMGDGIQFAMSIESGSLEQILRPNHMLYPLFGLWFHRLWQLLGWQQGALLPLQILSAIAGALSVGLFYSVVKHSVSAPRSALLVTVGFGSSHAIWLYSTDAEVVTIPLAFNLLILLLLLRTADALRWYVSFVIATLVVFSILIYQTSVFLVLMVMVAFAFTHQESKGRRLGHVVFFLGIVAFLLAFLYLFVGYVVLGFRTWQAFVEWQFELAQLGLWGELSLRNVGQGAYAMLRSVASFGGLGPSDRTSDYLASATTLKRVAFGLYYLLVFAAVAFPLGLLARCRKVIRDHARTLAILSCWAFFYAVFATYWVPGDMQFWAPVLVSWWFLVGLLLAGESQGKQRANDSGASNLSLGGSKWLGPSIAIGVLALIVANLVGAILPNQQPSQAYTIAESIAAHTSDSDLIITTGGDRLFLYVPYFADRRTVSLFHETLHGRGGKRAAFQRVQQAIDETMGRGGRAFLVGVQPGGNVWWDSLGAVGIIREDFMRFNTIPAWSIEGELILEVVRD